MKRFKIGALIALVMLLSVPSAEAGWVPRGVVSGKVLGVALYTPNTLVTLASTTPDSGDVVALPTYTENISVCVFTNKIHYSFSTTTAPTGAVGGGDVLEEGCWTLEYPDRLLIRELRFIDTAAGASTVRITFWGER